MSSFFKGVCLHTEKGVIMATLEEKQEEVKTLVNNPPQQDRLNLLMQPVKPKMETLEDVLGEDREYDENIGVEEFSEGAEEQE